MTEKDPESFTGRVAIVVGAARGIGAEIAALLSARGATVARADILRPTNGVTTSPNGIPGTPWTSGRQTRAASWSPRCSKLMADSTMW